MLHIKKKKKSKKLTKWKNEPSVEDLKKDLELAIPSYEYQMAKVTEWRDLYNIQNDTEKHKEGKSGINVKLIKKLGLWRQSVLQNPLTKNKELFKIQANSPTTILAAAQNQTLLNYQFNVQINKRKFIDTLLESLIQEGTAIIRVSWEYSEKSVDVIRPVYKYNKNPNKFQIKQIIDASKTLTTEGMYRDAILQSRGLSAIGKDVNPDLASFVNASTYGDDPLQSIEMLNQTANDPLAMLQAQFNEEDRDFSDILEDPNNPENDKNSIPNPDVALAGVTPMPKNVDNLEDQRDTDPLSQLLQQENENSNTSTDYSKLAGKEEEPANYGFDIDGNQLNPFDVVDSSGKVTGEIPGVLPDEVLKASVIESRRLGKWVIAYPTKRKEIQKEVHVVRNQPDLHVLPLESVYIDPMCQGDVNKAQFCIYSYETCLADLKAQGPVYQNIDELEKYIRNHFENFENQDTELYLNRNVDSNKHVSGEVEFVADNFDDIARKKFKVYEYWGYWDINGDGTSCPVVASFAGSILLRLDENPFPGGKLPFVFIQYHSKKDSVYGEPDAELLKDQQAQLSAINRMINTASSRSAAGQVAVPKGFLDRTNKALFIQGKNYEYNALGISPQEAIYIHSSPELPQALLAQYQQVHSDAESFVGINSHWQGMDQTAYMQPSQSGEMNAMFLTQIESSILDRISYGLQQMAQKIILMNTVMIGEEQTVPITSTKFIKIRPDDMEGLPEDVNVQVELTSIHETMAKIQKLSFLLQTIGPNLDFRIIQPILASIAQMSDLPGIAESIANYQPEPNPVEQQLAEAEIAIKQSEAMKKQAEAKSKDAEAEFITRRAILVESMTVEQNIKNDRLSNGTEHAEKLELMGSQANSQAMAKLAEKDQTGYGDVAKDVILDNALKPKTPPPKQNINQPNPETEMNADLNSDTVNSPVNTIRRDGRGSAGPSGLPTAGSDRIPSDGLDDFLKI